MTHIEDQPVDSIDRVWCPTCRQAPSQFCLTPRLEPREPHTARQRLAQHRIPLTLTGHCYPLAEVISVNEVNGTQAIRCPICSDVHRHGWDGFDDSNTTLRVSHCRYEAPIANTTRTFRLDYAIPPSHGAPRDAV